MNKQLTPAANNNKMKPKIITVTALRITGFCTNGLNIVFSRSRHNIANNPKIIHQTPTTPIIMIHAHHQ